MEERVMEKRAGIFDDFDLDVAEFKPKPAGLKKQEPSAEEIRTVSEASHFRSREPGQQVAKGKSKTMGRRHRTGRNVQLNIKLSHETIQAFHRIADRERWVLGEAFERAIAALEKELSAKNERFGES